MTPFCSQISGEKTMTASPTSQHTRFVIGIFAALLDTGVPFQSLGQEATKSRMKRRSPNYCKSAVPFFRNW